MRLFSEHISFNTHSRIIQRCHYKLFHIAFLLMCASQLGSFTWTKGY